MSKWILTREELRKEEKVKGKEQAANLLLLVGPDGYEGDYDDTMSKLTGQGDSDDELQALKEYWQES